MAIIANLDVQLGARTEKFDTNIAKAKRTSEGFAESFVNGGVQKAIPQYAQIAATIGTISVAGAIANRVLSTFRDEMDAIDATSDVAKRLGVGYSELIVARRSLSETSGLDDSAIDKSIQKLELNLVEASAGTGDLYNNLKRLGVDAGDLLKKGPIEQVKILSLAIRQLKNPADQMRLAFDLFGKEGVSLVNSLREGPGHLEEMARWARDVGLTLTEAQAEQVGAANDAWQKIEDISIGSVRQIAAEMAPIFNAAATGFAGTLRGTESIQRARAQGIANAFADVADFAIFNMNFGQFGDISNNPVREAMEEARREAEEAAKAADSRRRSEESIAKQLEDEKRALEEAQRLEERRSEKIKDRLSSIQEEVQVLRDAREAMAFQGMDGNDAKAYADELKTLRELEKTGADESTMAQVRQLQEEKRALTEEQRSRQDTEATRKQLQSPQEQLDSELTRLKDLFSRGFITQDMLARGIGAAREKAEPGRNQDASLLRANSKEAWKFLADAQRQERNEQLDKLEAMKVAQESQLEVQRQQLTSLQGIKTVGRAR